ncbi:HAUS augmin-like complex subunit 2 isoform X6 [Symphalangus syndactylus]|uniref:HAUS augmin-like complex subunit 2 isoform X6 n=1 Tax=Symphalangus syndactylus TaxID=9590 RepID=UPI002442EC2A|nr:HAUS augmin-like complex subunit 2 isoform X5 [Symphalangus syndactylus]
MAAANPWDPASAPNGAGLVLGHFIASGMVNQEMLNMSKKTASCFVNFTRLQQITNIQAEIYQKNLEIELLKLEKDTADVVHPFFLEMRSCYVAQAGLELMASILLVQSP